jgi:basic amino acid/polyamine antiporter, APA family
MSNPNNSKQITLFTASAIVIANMIGTAVFTSLGFQLQSVQNTITIIILWFVGGLLALMGAFAYAELGTHFKQNGGDYVYLSKIFGPLYGYLSAFTGLTVGFSAPVALAAMAFTKYLQTIGVVGYEKTIATALIVVIAFALSFSNRHSSVFQNFTTLIKVLFIIVLIVLGISISSQSTGSFLFTNSWQQEVGTGGFAVSMIYVSFAYSGWNAAAYVAGDIKNQRKNLPLALVASSIFVTIAYVLMQMMLLKHATVQQLVGKEEVSFIAFNNLFGTNGGRWVSVFIAIQLLATISSYLWVGPRVTQAMAADFTLFKLLGKTNKNNIPVYAVWAHALVAILLTLTGSFEKVMLYAGFVLQLMFTLTVATSLFLKNKTEASYKSPFRPWLQIIFLLFNTGVLVFTFIDKPVQSTWGLVLLLVGGILFKIDVWLGRRKQNMLK